MAVHCRLKGEDRGPGAIHRHDAEDKLQNNQQKMFINANIFIMLHLRGGMCSSVQYIIFLSCLVIIHLSNEKYIIDIYNTV